MKILKVALVVLATAASVRTLTSFSFFELFLGQAGDLLRTISNTLNGPKIAEPAIDRDIEEYDFVIIGAGAAGCILASRLTEIAEWKVLLLEAGVSESPIGEIPQISQILQLTQYSWGYQTIFQETGCLGMIDNKCNIPSGKGLGGGGAISDSIYARGTKQDYDIWAQLANKEWDYEETLPYHKKAEDVRLERFDPDYHGIGGPNRVEDAKNPSRIRQPFLDAAKELNYSILDYNGERQIGFSRTQVTTKRGKRHSVSKAYLESLGNRLNLVIKTSSNVTKISINSANKEAESVEYIRNGKTLLAKAKKEIILSAGAFNSPQLLMLSGIGPKDDLEKLGIECLHDLQVGQNLRDHVGFLGLSFVFNEKSQQEDYLLSFYEWLVRGRGPLTSCGIDALGFLNSGLSEDPEYSDIELALVPISLAQGYDVVSRATNFKREIYDSIWKDVEEKDTFNILVILNRARSTGSVKLRSTNVNDNPLIDPKYLSDPRDIEILLTGIKKAVELTETESFKSIGAEMNRRKVYGCEDHEFGSDHYWRCAIPALQVSTLHYSGTNKMGSDEDATAVVDEKLKVKGVKKLRVIDASVIPNANTGHMLGPVIMLAEKGADVIKEDWSQLF